MFVRNHIVPLLGVITVQDDDTAGKALKVMEDYGHDALPVLDEKRNLVGVVSKQHIYKVFFLGDYVRNDFLSNTLVREIMKTNFHTVRESDFIELALQVMSDMRMQFVAVINERHQFTGILTRKRLLRAMAYALGIDKKGLRVEIIIDDITGRLAALAGVLADGGYNIRSLFMFDPQMMNLQKIIMRVDTRDEERVIRLLAEAGFTVLSTVLE
jgi:acetoin utilization protein AcuB